MSFLTDTVSNEENTNAGQPPQAAPSLAPVEKAKEIAGGEKLIAVIKKLVAGHLEGRAPSLPFIAKNLGISGRTIQRRLAEEETSFQKLVDDVRQDQALVWVKNGDLTPAEMAFRLGFSQSSSFHRAFKQWTGRSFSQFRNSNDSIESGTANTVAE